MRYAARALGAAHALFRLVDARVNLVAISAAQRRQSPLRATRRRSRGLELDRYPLHEGPRDDFLLYIGRASRDKAPELAVELAQSTAAAQAPRQAGRGC